MRRLLLLLALLSCASAGSARSAQALPNGLQLLVRERHTTHLIAIDLWVRAGAREEAESEAGSAHFLEHVVFKGTTTRRVGEADEAIETLGGTLNAATGPDYAHFSTTVAPDHLPQALAVIADVMRHATLPDTEIERERGVILDELAQHEADPEQQVTDALYANGYSVHPYRRSPGGTPGSIRIRGRDTLAVFYRRNYTPERCALVLVGDVTQETARQAAQTAFGDWKPAEFSNSPAILPQDAPPAAPVETRIAGDSPNGYLGIGFRGPVASDGVTACAAQVTAALLSSDGGRLAEALPTVEVDARFTPRHDAGLFLLTAPLPPPGPRTPRPIVPADRLTNLENSVLAAVGSLQEHPPSASELLSAKRRILGRLQFQWETNAGLAYALGYAAIVGCDAPDAFRERLARITVQDVLEFARNFLAPTQRIVVKALPRHEMTAAPK